MDGKEIALNTKAEFDPPLGFGDKDWTNLTPVENEVQVSGMAGETTGITKVGSNRIIVNLRDCLCLIHFKIINTE